jgi:hypothetical protein
MTDHPEALPLRARTIGQIYADASDTDITVEHVYLPEGAFHCDGCGSGHDPGMVGLVVAGAGEGDPAVSAMLTAEEALVLANRLTRAASLVLEAGEQVPDIEREAARFSGREEPA